MRTCYLVGPISDIDPQEASAWRIEAAEHLRAIGYTVYDPLTAERRLKNRAEKSKKLDRRRVKNADILLCNFTNAKKASIGSIYELAWGDEESSIVIVIMEKDNCHNHGWIQESAARIFEKMEDGLKYLEDLAQDWR